jgi:putative transposase
VKRDERVLGDGDFVQDVSQCCRQQLERRYRLTVKGYDFDWLVGHVSKLFDLDPGLVTYCERYPDTVEARSVLCCWAAREFGTGTIELSRRLGISQPTASQSVKRGGRIVKDRKFELPGHLSQ